MISVCTCFHKCIHLVDHHTESGNNLSIRRHNFQSSNTSTNLYILSINHISLALGAIAQNGLMYKEELQQVQTEWETHKCWLFALKLVCIILFGKQPSVAECAANILESCGIVTEEVKMLRGRNIYIHYYYLYTIISGMCSDMTFKTPMLG